MKESRKDFSFLGNALNYLHGCTVSPSQKNSATEMDCKTSSDK